MHGYETDCMVPGVLNKVEVIIFVSIYLSIYLSKIYLKVGPQGLVLSHRPHLPDDNLSRKSVFGPNLSLIQCECWTAGAGDTGASAQ